MLEQRRWAERREHSFRAARRGARSESWRLRCVIDGMVNGLIRWVGGSTVAYAFFLILCPLSLIVDFVTNIQNHVYLVDARSV